MTLHRAFKVDSLVNTLISVMRWLNFWGIKLGKLVHLILCMQWITSDIK